jgi:4-hydroxyphenylacetate 3-monooxygenase
MVGLARSLGITPKLHGSEGAAVQCKTGSEHIDSLKDGRTVYIDGALVDDVTIHPAYRNAVASAARLYDYQSRPENLELMTFVPEGCERRVSRAWQMPRNYAELVQRRKALQAWAQVSYGFMGRSPDHVASSLIGHRMGIEVFNRYAPARAKALVDYVDYASRNDLFLTYVIVNPQADRSKDWGDQVEELVAQIVEEDTTGVTIRGAKMLGTSSIIANEVFVANLQPLKPGEEALAFSCALPMNTPGLRVLSRKSYEAHAVSVYDNPLSARFDENDALLYFDNVKVPWERVFVYRDTNMCRAQFHDTPAHVFQNYQAQIRLSVKMRFLVGLAHKITEAIGTTDMPQVREQLGALAANAGMVEAMLSGIEASGAMRGEFYLPNRHLVYAAQVITQDLYPRLITMIRDLAGGSLIMLPSSFRDWSNTELAPILHRTQRSPNFSSKDKVKLLKAAWDAIGSEFASRHVQYEMFYAGARFVATGSSYRTFDWGTARGMVDHLLSAYDLDDMTRPVAEPTNPQERTILSGREP